MQGLAAGHLCHDRPSPYEQQEPTGIRARRRRAGSGHGNCRLSLQEATQGPAAEGPAEAAKTGPGAARRPGSLRDPLTRSGPKPGWACAPPAPGGGGGVNAAPVPESRRNKAWTLRASWEAPRRLAAPMKRDEEMEARLSLQPSTAWPAANPLAECSHTSNHQQDQ